MRWRTRHPADSAAGTAPGGAARRTPCKQSYALHSSARKLVCAGSVDIAARGTVTLRESAALVRIEVFKLQQLARRAGKVIRRESPPIGAYTC
jgi:hypothetical protein